MGRIKDVAAEIRTVGLSLDDHIRKYYYTIFIDTVPAEYEVEARNLASRDSVGCGEIIKDVRERRHRSSGNREKGSNVGHAGHVIYNRSGGGGGGKGGGSGRGKAGGRRVQHGRGGRGTNEDGGGSAATASGDGRSAKVTSGITQVGKGHRRGKKAH